jgi:hypothetical protein
MGTVKEHFSALSTATGAQVRVDNNMVLGAARTALFRAQWTPRANAFLARFGLSVQNYNWIEDRRDDKGNKTGEVLKSALQVYRGAQPTEGWQAARAQAPAVAIVAAGAEGGGPDMVVGMGKR